MMDFSAALILLKQGCHIRRTEWTAGAYWSLGKKWIEQISFYAGQKITEQRGAFEIEEMLATDWEKVGPDWSEEYFKQVSWEKHKKSCEKYAKEQSEKTA
jgi:hypothetical protein